jgi:orotate phosphoribosyltransferase
MNIKQILKAYSWRYSGKSGEPHALLASGLHSNAYFDLSYLFFKEPRKVPVLAQYLVKKLEKEFDLSSVTVVVSSAMTAIVFGHEVAKVLGVKFAYCEKEGEVQRLKRFSLGNNDVVLQIEELITALKTTRQVTETVKSNNPQVEFLKDEGGKTVVGTIVHRPAKLLIEHKDYRIISILETEVHNWEPEQCPLCKQGSQALKPKLNWSIFQKYL